MSEFIVGYPLRKIARVRSLELWDENAMLTADDLEGAGAAPAGDQSPSSSSRASERRTGGWSLPIVPITPTTAVASTGSRCGIP